MAMLDQPQSALKYEVEVREHGRIELLLPLAPGSRVTVFVVADTREELSELATAAMSSTSFWDNPLDDEDWNNA